MLVVRKGATPGAMHGQMHVCRQLGFLRKICTTRLLNEGQSLVPASFGEYEVRAGETANHGTGRGKETSPWTARQKPGQCRSSNQTDERQVSPRPQWRPRMPGSVSAARVSGGCKLISSLLFTCWPLRRTDTKFYPGVFLVPSPSWLFTYTCSAESSPRLVDPDRSRRLSEHNGKMQNFPYIPAHASHVEFQFSVQVCSPVVGTWWGTYPWVQYLEYPARLLA